jgi:hypothetical protein
MPAPKSSAASSDPKPPLPVPQVLGGCILVAAVLGLIAGTLRHELVLTLLGTALLAVWFYCLLAVLFLAFIHWKRAVSLSVRIIPEPGAGPALPSGVPVEAIGAGQPGAVFCVREGTGGDTGRNGFAGKGRFFRLPGILIRYALGLSTKDGRRLDHFFDPDFLENNISPFNAPERGAYYGEQDRLLVFDILGLFRAAIIVPQIPGPRLLVMPQAAEQAPLLSVQSGGAKQRTGPRFLRTDDLIDHRPYVPGDDPRRINWKLYGHAGDLFVREGEPEPPPHSRLVILIDTQVDNVLYTAEAGRRGVDLLCENALALVLDYEGRGIDVDIGFSGGSISGGGPAELAAALACPAALSLSPARFAWELPLPEGVQGVLILALPRNWTEGEVTGDASGVSQGAHTAPRLSLDSFLKKRDDRQTVDMLFLYRGEDTLIERPKKNDRLEKSAEACVRFYGGKGGVRARHIRL